MKKFSFTQPLTPDLCGKQPKMQPPAAFLLFQNAASLHAEAIDQKKHGVFAALRTRWL